MRIHIKHMHDKLKDHVCEECGYAASEKGDLKKHRDAVHNTGEKFKCGLCPYESSWKRHVAKHMRDKHQRENNIQRRFGGEVPKEEAITDNPQPDEQDELDEELDNEVGQLAMGDETEEAEKPQRQEYIKIRTDSKEKVRIVSV